MPTARGWSWTMSCASRSACSRSPLLTAARRSQIMRVREVMTREVFTMSPSTSVADACLEMARRRIRHLLITDEYGLLVGIVTDRDIRSNMPSPATSLSVWEVSYLLARLTLAQVMSPSVIVVDPDRDVREAARIMIDHKIGALPVLEGREIVGIVSTTDLLRALAAEVGPLAVTS